MDPNLPSVAVPIRVLFIDDNPGDLELVRWLLLETRPRSFDFHGADSLSTGLDFLRTHGSDVVLLDLLLPESRGLETFRRVHAQYPRIPILVVSSIEDEALALEAVNLGAQDYLIKGQFDAGLLVRSIRYGVERQRLQNERDRFFALSVDLMAVCDFDGRLIHLNPAWSRALGFTIDEIASKQWIDLVHPADREATLTEWRRLLSGEVTDRFENRYRCKDGSYRWLSWSARAVPDERLCYAVARDVTGDKHAQLERKEREEQLRMAQRVARLGSWDFDPATETMKWSDELYRIYGMNPGDPNGGTLDSFERVHPEDRERLHASVRRALETKSPFRCEFRVGGSEDQERTVFCEGRPVLDDDGMTKMVGIVQDVTERKKALEELQAARDAALESSRLKSAFLVNMSHEIRTPLNVILGYNSLLAEHFGGSVDREVVAAVEGVERASKRLITMVHGILDLSRIETGVFEVTPRALEIPVVIEREVQEVTVRAERKGLAVCCRIEEPGATVAFDEHCLSRVLANLLDNAVKFTERGGISVRFFRDRDLGLCLEVRDTGVGIDAAYLPRLFQPFSQEEYGYTRRFEGSGLGLALVKKYAELNGAEVSVESEKGRGSAFRVHFPNQDPGRPQATVRPTAD